MYDQHFYWGRGEGVVDGGVAVRDVKVGKGESCSEGCFEGVTTLVPWKILIIQSPL